MKIKPFLVVAELQKNGELAGFGGGVTIAQQKQEKQDSKYTISIINHNEDLNHTRVFCFFMVYISDVISHPLSEFPLLISKLMPHGTQV